MDLATRPRACLTFDLHDSDRPADVERAVDWLGMHEIPATFFVPAALFRQPGLRRVLRMASRSALIEVGSHSFEHSLEEIAALMEGKRLSFLHGAYNRHADVLGNPPLSFRAPCWVPLADAALDTLAAIGYRVDSSATPGRPMVLSSFVGKRSWRKAPRRPHWIRPSMLEVPQTTRLIPFAIPTFMTIRRRGSRLMARHLASEMTRDPQKVLVTMLHVGDLNPRAPDYWRPKTSWRSLIPKAGTGFAIKYAFRETRRPQVSAIAHDILSELLQHYTLVQMQEVYHAQGGRAFDVPALVSSTLLPLVSHA